MLSTVVTVLAVSGACLAHGDHSQKPIIDPKSSWMAKHMAGKTLSYPILSTQVEVLALPRGGDMLTLSTYLEEHHATDFTAGSFFSLHDYDSDGNWEAEEILRTYGLFDDSNKHVNEGRKQEILREVLRLIDNNEDGRINQDEFQVFIEQEGGTLPDFGTGPGHHGDDEYEYEIHHWEKYHDENTKLEELTHPEDIEHFRKHDELEQEQERLDEMSKRRIVEENIPAKFKRTS